jgi:hypothetical protein
VHDRGASAFRHRPRRPYANSAVNDRHGGLELLNVAGRFPDKITYFEWVTDMQNAALPDRLDWGRYIHANRLVVLANDFQQRLPDFSKADNYHVLAAAHQRLH